ncbi:MAG TPA: MFS transporter [Anaerolineaceae bacterium]|uniref:Major facilitator transporter n=1 Tax=Anaerolinea thermophila TaxID=167964 RepID=A0A117LH67_9CHLR|nr:MAG: major facilitator transporter [Anaerolinea thermophila]HAF61258.1 MFS transporter [Anaerolineaceae bacterium]
MKSKTKSTNKTLLLIILFSFMLLHQTDKLLINPMGEMIINEFGLTDTQWGSVATAALIVGAIFYPIWGYLYDRFPRGKLLALASLIWGSTTWLSAIAPTFSLFIASRASTGIDDSSYPGLYSLIADYFAPKVRGKIFGLLQITMPLGYMAGLVLSMTVAVEIGWRKLFYITGGLGILLSIIIFFFVKDIPRGTSEPEMQDVKDVPELQKFHFEWSKVKDILKKPSLIFMYLQGFFGVFPWNTIVAFIFIYLGQERGYSDTQVLMTMAPAILILALGYPIGGMLGDHFFAKNKKGRVYVSMIGVLLGALLLYITLNIPVENTTLFGIMLAITAFFIPFASPNVTSIVNDITLPEMRSTAMAIQYFIESSGAALAPLLTGIISDALRAAGNPYPRGNAILIICTSAWLLCGIFFFITSKFIDKDINSLHETLQERAAAITAGESNE